MNTPGNYPPVTTGKHGLAVFIRRYLPIGPFYPAGIGPFLPTNVGPYHPTLTVYFESRHKNMQHLFPNCQGINRYHCEITSSVTILRFECV